LESRDQRPSVSNRPVTLAIGAASGEDAVAAERQRPVFVGKAVVIEPQGRVPPFYQFS